MARVGESENERSLGGEALRVGGGILPRVEAEYSRGAGDFTPASVHATALTLLPLTGAFARDFFTHARTACRLESSGCIRSPSVAVSLHSLPLDSLDCLKKILDFDLRRESAQTGSSRNFLAFPSDTEHWILASFRCWRSTCIVSVSFAAATTLNEADAPSHFHPGKTEKL